MEKHFRVKNKLWITLLSIALLVILLVGITLNILAILDVGSFHSNSHIADIIAIIVMAIIMMLIIVFVFTSNYSIKEQFFTIRIGFFISKIPYDNILMARYNSSKTMLLLYVQTSSEKADIIDGDIKANILQINIDSSKVDSFISSMKNVNKMMIVEIRENEVEK